MVINIDLNFVEWGKLIGDAKMTKTLFKRVTYQCSLIETKNDSNRFRSSKKDKNIANEGGSDLRLNSGSVLVASWLG